MSVARNFLHRIRSAGSGPDRPRADGRRRIGLFVDADNQSQRGLGDVVDRAQREGQVPIRRAYGDWMDPGLNRWRDECVRHAVQQVQATAFSIRKNATDLAMAIDIMECCLTDQVDSIWIISGDSDFTSLVGKLREYGIHVVGAGGRNVSNAFRRACDEFIDLDSRSNRPPANRPARTSAPAGAPAGAAASPRTDASQAWEDLVGGVLPPRDSADSDEGWMTLAALGSSLRAKHPGFNHSDYGFNALRKLVGSRPDLFEIEGRVIGDPNSPHLYVRLKPTAPKRQRRRRRLPRPTGRD